MEKETNISNHHRVDSEPSVPEEFFILGSQDEGSPFKNRIRRFLSKVSVLLEYGYASSFYLDLFEKGVISRDIMLEKLDELDRTFNRHMENS